MLLSYLLAHIWTVLTAFASVLLTIHVLASQRSPQSVLAWLLALIFVPPVGIPLYMLLGTRKIRQRRRGAPWLSSPAEAEAVLRATPGATGIQRVLAASGLAPARGGGSLRLLTDAEEAFRALLELIGSARRTVHLSYFILGDDESGRAIVDALVVRAAAGVEVRVVLDAVGSRRMLRRARRPLAEAGARMRPFNPLLHMPFRGRSNLRSHRKLAIVDGTTLFTGGMNLATEYLGPTPRPGRWRDVAAIVGGPVVRDAADLFVADWLKCNGRLSELTIADAPLDAGEAVLQHVSSGPDVADDALYEALITAAHAATERVAIVTPYYVPDDPMQLALLLAARRGVRTELVVPVRSNHTLADFARRGPMRELRRAGVAIHGYPRMIHAKAMIVDDRFAYLGSPNYDVRSLLLNYENALFVYSRPEVEAMAAWVDGLRAECTTEVFEARRHEWRLVEQVARLLAPEL